MTAFGDLPRQTNTDAALRDLTHSDARVRVAAAEALDRAPSDRREEVCGALRDALDDGRGDVRYAAALSLRSLGDARAVDRLIDMLEDRDVHARQAAAMALGHIGDSRAVEPLITALAEGSPDVRFQAIPSLAELGDPRAVGPILAALADRDAEVRANAAAALGDFGALEAADALGDRLRDSDETVRFEAALSLARLRDVRAVEWLCGFCRHSDFGPMACDALGRLVASSPAQGDAAASKEPTKADREAAKQAMTRAWRRFLAPPLLRVEAAAALLRLGEEAPRAYLERAVRSRRPEVRGLALERLGQVGGARALPILEAALAGPSLDAAARGLGALGDARALAPLRQALARAGEDEELRLDLEAAIASVDPKGQVDSEDRDQEIG